jgi:predicted alpha/beta-fold hydrolase
MNNTRRNLLTAAFASAGLAAIELPCMTSAHAASTAQPLAPIRQVKAGELDVGYYEAGPADGQPVLLLHGWPYDIHSFAEVAPLLARQGYRVVVPHLRGHGSTRFLSGATLSR